jgi:type II secretory pathway pseudopilin PulG
MMTSTNTHGSMPTARLGGRPAARRTSGGFTLIETCVVMAVAFVLLSSLWLVYRGVTKAGRSTEDTALAVARAQLAMERIRNDLLSSGAGTASLGEDGTLQISRGKELVASYEQTAADGLVRTAGEKTIPGPEETTAKFAPVPGKPASVAITVTSTSHDRTVVLHCEHASEGGARRLQHPEWNPLTSDTESPE